MLFGRQPRTLLVMLAEQWEDTEEEVKDLLTYTRDLRENLHTVWEEAHTALQEAQDKQKQRYDTRSSVRTLSVGDKALVFLPSTDNKLLTKWEGPFEVIAQINPTTYKLAFPQGSGREQIHHINLLKKWLEPTGDNSVHFINSEITDDIPYPKITPQDRSNQVQPWINPDLTKGYHNQLTRLVQHNQDVFSKYPELYFFATTGEVILAPHACASYAVCLVFSLGVTKQQRNAIAACFVFCKGQRICYLATPRAQISA
ncbi:hypothetical protein NDU88_004319 [Pleurodeles waltl]|uniref:Tf2-1-like SH3-like domain-containing protein n=1 Tax=Pleurodeles waltl TaxID=8319 RepID=A0AAV7L137_PLEWA|nr:hypothetical protein NDU88_004319 [Pleurodeles waltl]